MARSFEAAINEQRPPTCSVCGSSTVQRDPYYYDWHGSRYWIMRCRTCTHQFVHPPIAAAHQEAIYADHYFSRDGDWVCGLWDADYRGAEPQLRYEAREILGMLPLSSGRLLDIGCAGGVFLDEARQRGFEVTGIELNASMALHARSKYGLEVMNARLEEVDFHTWNANFDVIVLLDSLEHIPAPNAAIQKTAQWVKLAGYLFIRGPLANSRIARLKEAVRRGLGLVKRLPGYPLDASSFNKQSLSVLVSQNGFVVDRWINETASFANLLCHRVP